MAALPAGAFVRKAAIVFWYICEFEIFLARGIYKSYKHHPQTQNQTSRKFSTFGRFRAKTKSYASHNYKPSNQATFFCHHLLSTKYNTPQPNHAGSVKNDKKIPCVTDST